jgi:hypothetical protein
VAAAGFVIFAGYSTIAASASSLPGQPLYSVKLAVEEVRVSVANVNDRPRIYLEHAEHRIYESKQLTDNKQYSEAERTAKDAVQTLDSARSLASTGPQTEQILSDIDDASNRAQEAVVTAARHTTPAISALPDPAPKPPVAPAPAREAQPPVAVPPTATNTVVRQPAQEIPVVRSSAGLSTGPSVVPSPTPAAAAPLSQVEIIPTPPAQPTRTGTATTGVAHTAPATPPAAAPTQTRTSAPASATPTTMPAPTAHPTSTPGGQPGVSVPSGGIEVIPTSLPR